MNAVEIEQAISELAEAPFDAAEFPYAFLTAFGNKETTIKRLRAGTTNKSDLDGVLQTNNVHLKVCDGGAVDDCLKALRESPATTKGKVKFIVATDGEWFAAEELNSGEVISCEYANFPDHFGFFLSLAGISTVKQIRESAFDIKATGRLNRLYVQLLKDNPDWGTAEKRSEMNHFMARLIFCFFAEDTDIFRRPDLFTDTIEQMSASDASNTHEIIMELFRAMNTKFEEREKAGIARWANELPYVNGGLFSGSVEVPKFTRIARSYLLTIGQLNWKQINPDIFGSMIQAVADDEERGELGMHYTSVPNILKVLNPLFLDDLREQLEAAGDNGRKLLNLRNRMARIRVFDPACGSGNFLVIAYKQMREIEAEINRRRKESENRSVIPLTNFRGIEIRDFSAEVARLALIIAEYQCDVLYRGQKEAIQDFLPLQRDNWITCANALQVDWLSICPPTGTGVKHRADDLFQTPLDQAEIDFENEGGETYICGNPPYKGTKNQTDEQKADIQSVFSEHVKTYKSLDYVACWFLKAALYARVADARAAFVSTNSICQGGQVPLLWPLIFSFGFEITFAHTSFLWRNLASHNAGVTVAIVGFGRSSGRSKTIYSLDADGNSLARMVANINPYLVPSNSVVVSKSQRSLSGLPKMSLGNQPYEGNNLILDPVDYDEINLSDGEKRRFTREFFGSSEFIRGGRRFCLWLKDDNLDEALQLEAIRERVARVKEWRSKSTRAATRAMACRSHQFCEMNIGVSQTIIIPIRSSENRDYLPVGLLNPESVG